MNARTTLLCLACTTLTAACAPTGETMEGAPPANGSAEQALVVTDHPRLWITGDDLPRLRAWATTQNPIRVRMLVALDRRVCTIHASSGPSMARAFQPRKLSGRSRFYAGVGDKKSDPGYGVS